MSFSETYWREQRYVFFVCIMLPHWFAVLVTYCSFNGGDHYLQETYILSDTLFIWKHVNSTYTKMAPILVGNIRTFIVWHCNPVLYPRPNIIIHISLRTMGSSYFIMLVVILVFSLIVCHHFHFMIFMSPGGQHPSSFCYLLTGILANVTIYNRFLICIRRWINDDPGWWSHLIFVNKRSHIHVYCNHTWRRLCCYDRHGFSDIPEFIPRVHLINLNDSITWYDFFRIKYLYL